MVDDCSTDNSREVILDIEATNTIVRHVFLETNHGVSFARNAGIKASMMDFVTFLDADDFYYNSKKLENEFNLLQEHGFNCISYSLIKLVDADGVDLNQKIKRRRHYMQGRISTKLLSNYWNDVLMRDFLIPKVYLNNIYFDEKLNLFEDYLFLINLSRDHMFYCTFEYGTAYRIKEFGLSKKPKDIVVNTKRKIRKEALKELNPIQRFFVFFFDLISLSKRVFSKMIRR